MRWLRPFAAFSLLLVLALALQGSVRVWHQQGMPGSTAMSLCSAGSPGGKQIDLPAPTGPQVQCSDCTAAVAIGDGPPLWPWVAPRPPGFALPAEIIAALAPRAELPRDRLAPPRAPPIPV
ncbi:hypothetical protein IGB42_02670 [Andreprevotia sp. IGB-42]|uniref:hypothetical protein n=1 Tax=Andreprevotia sp. IGB-42 TaxID=2497473 RepID=UPI0013580FBE|nr:hypothetical protein [Andreprevotia sp. IGB-42]KAF0812827.1 hypothetical protein IGB42_02670 [Andreprevotia sp. IGB-42]